MRIIRAADYRRMAWKNGGGSTTEVAAAPADATLDNFDWRISMAHVATPGPFSQFAGVDRSLAVINGDGIQLTIAGQTVRLDRTSPPHFFAGDAVTTATLSDGPIDDLNVMGRRTCCRHRLTRHLVGETFAIPRDADEIFVMPRGGDIMLVAGTSTASVANGDAAILDRPDVKGAKEMTLRPGKAPVAEVYLIVFWRLAAPGTRFPRERSRRTSGP